MMTHASHSTIDRVDPRADAGWDSRLVPISSSSVFQGAGWARTLAETYGFTPIYLVQKCHSTADAILPLMEIRSIFTGRRGVSLPFTDHVEPTCGNDASFASLFGAAIEIGHSRGWKFIEFRGGSRHLETTEPSLRYHGHQLLLSRPIEELFSRCQSSVRRAIRKAEGSGITVEFSRSMEAVREFYGLLTRTRQRHGVPPQPFAFFKNLHRNILSQNQGSVVLARKGATLLAGAVYLHHKRTVIYKYGASDERFQEFRGNNSVMWSAIKTYAAQGMEILDFGRTSLRNEGLRRFKLGWGTTETQINYFKYDLRTRQFHASGDDSAGWYNSFFRIMPRALSAWIGALMYKHVA
jgi:hypothetical protein